METLRQEYDDWKKDHTAAYSNFNTQHKNKITNVLWQLKRIVVLGIVECLHLIGIQELWHKETMKKRKSYIRKKVQYRCNKCYKKDFQKINQLNNV